MSDRPEGSSRASRWTGDDIRIDNSDKYSDAGVSDSGASSLPSPDFTPVDGEFTRRPGEPMSGVQATGDGEDSSTSSGWESEDLPASRSEVPPPLDSMLPPRPPRAPQLAQPSLVIGSQLGTGLSAIEKADAEVERWELIYQEILMVQGAAAVVSIGESLEKAREARRKLDLVEDRDAVEGTFTETEYFRKRAVDDRVQLLRFMLEDAEEEDTIANMEGAVRAYEDGTVGVSEQYAIFWAGHFMELASSYEEFTRDRYERTEAYARVHGPGSLWFEPPLIPVSPAIRVGRHGYGWPMAMRGTASGVGKDSHHFVTMSFQAVRYHQEPDYPGRLPGPSGAKAHDASLAKARRFKGRGTTVKAHVVKSITKPNTTTDAGILVANPDKPRLCFSMMLDTGATHPCLYEADLAALGIKFKEYPAASVTVTQTANGSVKCYVYELHVAMCDTQTGSSLVDSGDPVWPSRPHILGGISRVIAFPGNQKVHPGHVGELDQNGEVKEFLYDAWKESLSSEMGRLSGLFPIQCCYVQSTPGLRAVWFGEDRRDVLGTQRMPGQRRFEPGNNVCPPEPEGPELALLMDRHGEQADPVRLQMEHVVVNKAGIRQFRIRDIETKERGRSELHIDDFVTKEQTEVVEPRKKRRQSLMTRGSDDEYDDDDDATRKRRREARRILTKLRNESLFFPPPKPPSAGTAA